MSNITSILTAILALTPQYDTDVAINTRDIDGLQEVLQPDDCPVRMVTVADAGQSGGLAFITMGKLQRITWVLTDRLYLKKSSLGEGSKEWSEKLILYAASYAEQIRQNRAIYTQATIVEVEIEPGIFAWPEGSDRNFAGVECVLTIDEYISGA